MASAAEVRNREVHLADTIPERLDRMGGAETPPYERPG
jgi:hypothetical protein